MILECDGEPCQVVLSGDDECQSATLWELKMDVLLRWYWPAFLEQLDHAGKLIVKSLSIGIYLRASGRVSQKLLAGFADILGHRSWSLPSSTRRLLVEHLKNDRQGSLISWNIGVSFYYHLLKGSQSSTLGMVSRACSYLGAQKLAFAIICSRASSRVP